jgi:flavin-dependent dehydrogenase
MALQSGELAAGLILKFLEQHASEPALAELTSSYRTAYRQIFDSRLRVSSLMRRAAFVSGFANLGILLFSRSEGLRQRLTHATRGGVSETCSLANRPR